MYHSSTVRSLGHLQSLLAMMSFQTNMWSAAREYLRSARNAVAIQCKGGGVMTQPNNTGAPRAAVVIVNVLIRVLQCIPPLVI
jgi:hypothetical protein